MKIKARRTLKGRGEPEEASVLLALKAEDRVMSQDKQVASKFSSMVWKKKTVMSTYFWLQTPFKTTHSCCFKPLTLEMTYNYWTSEDLGGFPKEADADVWWDCLERDAEGDGKCHRLSQGQLYMFSRRNLPSPRLCEGRAWAQLLTGML